MNSFIFHIGLHKTGTTFLQRIPGLPTLNNRLFHRLNITPRALCQRRLTNYGNAPFALSKATEAFLREEYDED